MVSRFLAAAAAALALPLCAAEPAPNAPAAAAPATLPVPNRPRIALVLSGGGARGLAHIGVLKVLREKRIPVHLIVATSMGSIVGGAYAAGHTPEEMEALLANADWSTMFSDRAPRKDLSFRRKEDDLRLVGRSELGIKRDGLVFPRGAFGSQNLEEFLRLVARPASDARHLDALPIPLRAVATDLETGELVVLHDVSLPAAMRASMSVPGVFAPIQIEGRLLGDGGLVRNLPVEVARGMGADVIIAVNVGTPLLPRAALDSALGVAQQMINILTEQNVGISLAAMRPADILISPQLSDVTFVDFERGPELVERGVSGAKAAAERLQALAIEPEEYALYEARRTRRPEYANEPVDAILVKGAERTNPVALEREIRDRSGVAVGQAVTDEQLVTAGRLLYGTGEFERVDTHVAFDQGRKLVVIDVDEKPWGPNYLRIGGRAQSDFHTDARFSLILQHTRTWVNAWGAEWRNEIEIGDVRRFMTSFYQPLGPGSPWFMEPVVQSVQSDFDIFTDGNRRTDRITEAKASAGVALGRRLGSIAVARLVAGHERYRSTPLISSTRSGTTKDSADFAGFGVNFDTLDEPNFPRRGYLIDASATSFDYSSDPGHPVQAVLAQALVPVTFDRLTLLGLASWGRSKDDRGGFGLGGLFNLSGTPINAVAGSQLGFAAALAYYRMGDLPRAMGTSWYAGMSIEAGNAWAKRSDVSLGDVRKAASVFVGLDTILGPFYFGYGHTFGGDSAFYFFLGRPTNRN